MAVFTNNKTKKKHTRSLKNLQNFEIKCFSVAIETYFVDIHFFGDFYPVFDPNQMCL